MARFIIFLAALCLSHWPAAAELVKWHDFDIVGWDASVYGESQTGKFANCMATGRYEGGVDFHVVVLRDYKWVLGFSSAKWDLPPGSIRLGYRFDEGQWYSTDAITEPAGGLVLWDMASDPTQITLFRRSRVMDISILQSTHSFKLTGTSRLLATLAQCVKVTLDAENGVRPQKPKTLSKPKTKTAAKTKPAATTNKAESEPQANSGTGFIVSRNGHILTNNHVVRNAARSPYRAPATSPALPPLCAPTPTTTLPS